MIQQGVFVKLKIINDCSTQTHNQRTTGARFARSSIDVLDKHSNASMKNSKQSKNDETKTLEDMNTLNT
jgi:hypothetical protein